MPPSTLRVAAGQMGPASDDPKQNAERIVRLVVEAGSRSVDWVCFPETALTPYFARDTDVPADWYHTLDDAIVTRITDEARAQRVAVVLGFAEQSPDGRFNSAATIDRDGRIVSVYRKFHVTGPERNHFSPGTTIAVQPVGDLRTAVLICADRSYPEEWRVFGVEGAQVVFVPYGTALDGRRGSPGDPGAQSTTRLSKNVRMGCPPGADPLEWLREYHEVRERACAAMNGYYVVAAAKAGVERGATYIGNSVVISPWGNILARASGDGDELVVADIDLDVVREFRETSHYKRRAPSAYAALTR